ncbi:MAG TPA: NrfD/PsrC family molybdoenzyme membrane anchor subunit [Syntrophorhabdales bacterium]|nr:NrfD/PsrC family molybdoenzyme membrane anchor subunit [Syntrophorhabdales bacterium]
MAGVDPDTNVRFDQVNDEILRTLGPPPRSFWVIIGFLLIGVMLWPIPWGYQIATGMGSAGYRPSVMWILYIVNFVYWIAIGHSGTFISAILYLFRARFRTPISRATEAMTIFSVFIAAMFPFVHLGRVWIFYWILPYPNHRTIWPDFQSPLIFDLLAVSTYFTVSLVFWYSGLVPDIAAIRDRVRGLKRKIYGYFSLGWSGTDRQWHHYSTSILLMAGLATPLVISVHSVVSWDFALAIIPGYHSTIFPPYFVAGAIHQGIAMVLVLLVPLRKIFRVKNIITDRTLDLLAQTDLLFALVISYTYLTEHFMAEYSGNIFERQQFMFRMVGWYSPEYWIMTILNAIVPLVFFIRRCRYSPFWLMTVGVAVLIGMYLERFIIIIGSMSQDFLPYQWGFYWPGWLESCITFGSFCLFFLLFALFAKFLPSISIAEVKEALKPMRGKKEPTL